MKISAKMLLTILDDPELNAFLQQRIKNYNDNEVDGHEQENNEFDALCNDVKQALTGVLTDNQDRINLQIMLPNLNTVCVYLIVLVIVFYILLGEPGQNYWQMHAGSGRISGQRIRLSVLFALHSCSGICFVTLLTLKV